jgi:hypothetical protein
VIAISYEELAARLLAEIRSQPGCEGVSEVSIDRITDERASNNWAVGTVDCDNASRNTAQRAAIYAAAKLKRDFNLLSDA